MSNPICIHCSKKAGFTLVELAIALMVIGLLIGGVLKGRELIENTRVIATMRDIESFDLAVRLFHDVYDSIPGDIKNPSARLPSCTTVPCSTTGDGNHKLTQDAYGIYLNKESRNFWLHLAKAGYLKAVSETNTNVTFNAATFRWGEELPKARYEDAGYVITGASPSLLSADYTYDANHAFMIRGVESWAAPPVLPKQAKLLDEKMDDGNPYTGIVLARDLGSPTGSGECIDPPTRQYSLARTVAGALRIGCVMYIMHEFDM